MTIKQSKSSYEPPLISNKKVKRMKSIKEKADGYVSGFHPSIQRMCKESFGDGANYVLDEIEAFMKDLDLGNSAEEKFCKLDVLADIGLFIEQLKK